MPPSYLRDPSIYPFANSATTLTRRDMDQETSGAAGIYRLPEECVAYAISLTSPGDACHSSAVSPAFHAAADSDAVWDRFLPPDHAAVLARADEPIRCSSRKELFSRLCSHPVLLDGATMSFWLERRSGAKCYMLSARALSIAWGDEPMYWRWTSLPGSRFPEVAELLDVCWLEITGKLQLALLSPRTTYAAYLAYALADETCGLDCHIGIRPPKASVTVTVKNKPATVTSSVEHSVCFQHVQGVGERVHRRKQAYTRLRRHFFFREVQKEADEGTKCPRERGDGWMEVELGEWAVADGGEGEVEVSLREVEDGHWKRGLIVQGIEIRPKHAH